jgi:tetratricopeptide (TPR) repeat protein
LADATAPIPAVPAPVAPAHPLGDVSGLMDTSRPKPTIRQAGRAILAVWCVTLVGILLGLNAAALQSAALIATLGGSIFLTLAGAALRRENAALDHVEALLALRRTDEAVPLLHGLMSRAMRATENRLRAMLMLGGLLSRLGRTDDAIAVYTELIETEGLAGPGGAAVRTARANEMLRADHLFDADRAINELRRLLDRGGVAAEMKQFDLTLTAGPDAGALAGLRLLELYRDVKTGHLGEAVDHFEAQLPMLRTGLGHRIANAHALAAIALHQLNRPAEAAARYADATALAPLSELVRRYPELWPLTNIYPATSPPR